MRNPARKLAGGLISLGLGVLLFWLALSERLGAEDSGITVTAGWTGIALLCAAVYFVPTSLFAARGRARSLAGADVIARWRVSAADWERYRTGSRSWSYFTPRRKRSMGEVEIIAGKRSVLIDDCYFSPRSGQERRNAERRMVGENRPALPRDRHRRRQSDREHGRLRHQARVCSCPRPTRPGARRAGRCVTTSRPSPASRISAIWRGARRFWRGGYSGACSHLP